jgi:enoyl-CoA hydratase/carnithine racemase
MSAGAVLYEPGDDGITTITISQPNRRNAMTYPMMTQLFMHLKAASEDDACRVVILTGADGTFCSGIDLKFLSGIPASERGYPGPLHDERGWWNITACSKPVIAAIDGVAVGMGAEWASMCDIRIGTSRCRFAWNFVHRGLIPDTGAGTWLLPRLIGVQAALRLVLSGDWLDCQEARELGLLAAVVEPDQLRDAARAQALRFMSGKPGAVAETKRLLYDGLNLSVQDHQESSRAALLARFEDPEHATALVEYLTQ